MPIILTALASPSSNPVHAIPAQKTINIQASQGFASNSLDFSAYYEDEGHPGPSFLLAHQSTLKLTALQAANISAIQNGMNRSVSERLHQVQQAYDIYSHDSRTRHLNPAQIVSDINRAGTDTTALALTKLPYYQKADAVLNPTQLTLARQLLPAPDVAMADNPVPTPVNLKAMDSAQRTAAMAYFQSHSLGYGPHFIDGGHPGPRWILMHKTLLSLSSAQIVQLTPLENKMEYQAISQEPYLQADYAQYAWNSAHNAPLSTIAQDIVKVGQETTVLGKVMLPTHLQADALLTPAQISLVDQYYQVRVTPQS
jgi:hypothetical protein